jgi:hypothetical protein
LPSDGVFASAGAPSPPRVLSFQQNEFCAGK